MKRKKRDKLGFRQALGIIIKKLHRLQEKELIIKVEKIRSKLDEKS